MGVSIEYRCRYCGGGEDEGQLKMATEAQPPMYIGAWVHTDPGVCRDLLFVQLQKLSAPPPPTITYSNIEHMIDWYKAAPYIADALERYNRSVEELKLARRNY